MCSSDLDGLVEVVAVGDFVGVGELLAEELGEGVAQSMSPSWHSRSVTGSPLELADGEDDGDAVPLPEAVEVGDLVGDVLEEALVEELGEALAEARQSSRSC